MCDDPQFNLDEDDEKVVYAEDEKVENAIEIVLLKEDHTLGNLIRMQLHTNDNVLFSGYKGKATYDAPPPQPTNPKTHRPLCLLFADDFRSRASAGAQGAAQGAVRFPGQAHRSVSKLA